MPDFAVSTAFTSQDRISAAFRKMGKNADRFGKSAKSSFQKASRAGSRFRDIVKGILAAAVLRRGFNLLGRGLRTASTEFIAFDDAATSAVAKFSEIDLATKKGQAAFLRIKTAAREMGAATEFTAAQSAEALDFLALAGFNADQAIASLPGTIDLATAAQTDLARATDIVSDSLGAFGLMTKDSDQLQINLARTNDVMAKTMTTTNTNIEDLFETIKKGAPVFTAAGQSIESFAALAGTMASSGVKGSQAGTQLKNAMLRLAKPSAEATKELDKLGITVEDNKGDFRDIIDIIADFEKGLKGMGTKQRSAALATILGRRAVTGFNVLLKKGSKNLREYRETLLDSGGATKKMADIMRTSLEKRLAALKSAAIELGFRFIDAFKRRGKGAIETITEAIRNFDMQPVIEAVKLAFNVFSNLLSLLQKFWPEIKIIIAGFVAYKLALSTILALGAIKSFIVFIGVLKTMGGAWIILNAIIAANPILFVVSAVTALIVGLSLLRGKFAIIDTLFQKLTALKNIVFGFAKSAIGGVFDFFVGGNDETGKQKAPVPREIIAPNREEIKLRRQEINFKGQLNIAGAPPGSTFEGNTTGAPPIDVSMLGANP
jgi:TP901 family phage tail tape measure protein